MLLAHGYTGSRAVSTQFIDLFTEEGYNVLLIDQRRHGRSEGRYTTYGYYEKHDVQAWVRWLIRQYGQDVAIGLHGQSLGGGTVLEYLSIAEPQVKLVIADCPYSDLTDLMRHQLHALTKSLRCRSCLGSMPEYGAKPGSASIKSVRSVLFGTVHCRLCLFMVPRIITCLPE